MNSVLRVGVDGKPLLPPRAGVARYLGGLLAGCAAVSHPEVELDVVTPTKARRTLPWVVWNLQRATGRGYSVFHFPFYYPPLAPRCPITVAIHDVLVLEHPEWFPRPFLNPLRHLAPRGARLAAAVVTGSRCVADAFAPSSPEQCADVRVRLTLSKPYLLQLGALEPRRGVDLALAAVASLRVRDPDLELVLVGTLRAPVPVLEHPPPWVRFLGRVEDADLPALYAGAEAVLAPSRGEGFNLPLLEALACGAVVVASDIPVHREHFTPAVELFTSGDAEALAAVAGTVLGDSGRAATLRAAGPALAAGFDWVDVARRHLDLWRQVGRR